MCRRCARSGGAAPVWPEPVCRARTLVLVVGPSGAGKDSILRRARDRLGPDAPVRFARRVVTRPADEDENNEAATPEAFGAARAAGAFALDWSAHGLHYGIPWRALDAMDPGAIVVVNGSRTVAARARALPATVRIVLVTAPVSVLQARILGRGREAEASARLARDVGSIEDLRPDIVIDNSGSLDVAVDTFLDFLSEQQR